jgi:hypothetical protein
MKSFWILKLVVHKTNTGILRVNGGANILIPWMGIYPTVKLHGYVVELPIYGKMMLVGES